VTDVAVETPPDRLTTCITGNDAFFVRHHWPAKPPDPEDWALVVDGEVRTPAAFCTTGGIQRKSTSLDRLSASPRAGERAGAGS
jgi:hypothetical protein